MLFKVAIRSGGFDFLVGGRVGFRGFWPGDGMLLCSETF